MFSSQGISCSSFMRYDTTRKGQCRHRRPENAEILLVSELVRPRAVSRWVWVCTVVIYDHDLDSQSTRYHYQRPKWSPVRSNLTDIRHIRDEKSRDFGRQDGLLRGWWYHFPCWICCPWHLERMCCEFRVNWRPLKAHNFWQNFDLSVQDPRCEQMCSHL